MSAFHKFYFRSINSASMTQKIFHRQLWSKNSGSKNQWTIESKSIGSSATRRRERSRGINIRIPRKLIKFPSSLERGICIIRSCRRSTGLQRGAIKQNSKLNILSQDDPRSSRDSLRAKFRAAYIRAENGVRLRLGGITKITSEIAFASDVRQVVLRLS